MNFYHLRNEIIDLEIDGIQIASAVPYFPPYRRVIDRKLFAIAAVNDILCVLIVKL